MKLPHACESLQGICKAIAQDYHIIKWFAEYSANVHPGSRSFDMYYRASTSARVGANHGTAETDIG